MKKSMQFRFAVMFSLFTASIFMTNEAMAQSRTTHTFAEKTMAKLSNSFSFNLIATPCYTGGTGYRVQISQPQKYAFLWEVNGQHGGHQMSIDCACGEYAKVRVMRLSDGLQITRTVRLGKCGDENQ